MKEKKETNNGINMKNLIVLLFTVLLVSCNNTEIKVGSQSIKVRHIKKVEIYYNSWLTFMNPKNITDLKKDVLLISEIKNKKTINELFNYIDFSDQLKDEYTKWNNRVIIDITLKNMESPITIGMNSVYYYYEKEDIYYNISQEAKGFIDKIAFANKKWINPRYKSSIPIYESLIEDK